MRINQMHVKGNMFGSFYLILLTYSVKKMYREQSVDYLYVDVVA